MASGQYLGFLSVGHTEPTASRKIIFGGPSCSQSLLPQRSRIPDSMSALLFMGRNWKDESGTLPDPGRAEQSEEARRVSEERFQKVFRSSPIPFSITTLAEGRFLDVNRRLRAALRLAGKKCSAIPSMN